MRSPSPLRRMQAWLFVLPLLSLGCNGSSPTEPVLEQPKAAPAAVTATAEGQTAPVVASGEEGSTEGLRGGAARFSAARAAAAQDARPEAETPNVAVAARGGNGNGNGNGNGGGNGGNGGHGNGGGNGGNGGGGNGGNGGSGGSGGGGRGGELTFEIRPDVWNTNWVHAEGNVQAFVRGRDVSKIDTASVELEAEGGDTLAPESVRVAGGQLVATFAKSDAFEMLGDDVKSGDRVTLTLNLKVGDEAKELEDQIRVVGKDPDDGGGDDDGEGEVDLNIQPDDWNVNWEHSSGQVHAFLRGDLKDIKLDSIRLVGDKADAEELKPLDARKVGKQIVARFSKSAAYKTLDDPDAGETHTVKIRFKQGDADKELSEDVHIVGRQ